MKKQTEYSIGRYTDGFGPGNAGLWYVERKTTEVVALAESQHNAAAVAKAMKVADDANPS